MVGIELECDNCGNYVVMQPTAESISKNQYEAICKMAHIDDISDLSDGYHTFKQLYYQRMILFAALVKQNRDKAWKSLRHEDGEPCFGGGWFIVGIDTPEGSYTYHYEDKYFSLFDCAELERGKHWDGHTEKDVTRLLSLEQEPCEDCISRHAVLELCDMRYMYKIPYEYDDDRGCHVKGYDDCSIINVAKLKKLPPVTQLSKGNGRKFKEIIVQYLPDEFCIYPEYKGKPYFSIKYEENGKHIIGYGTYDPEVLSGYLRDYFITPTIEADKIEREE